MTVPPIASTGRRMAWGLWIAPGVFLAFEIEFEPTPERVHWAMVPWACLWNDIVLQLRRFHGS